MRTGYRIFLQALVLSFLGHAMFFSLFNVQDIEFKKKGSFLPITMLQMRQHTAGRVEAATSSNPELIDPKLVQLAEKVKRTTSPKLQTHRMAIVWEEEIAARVLEPDMFSWLIWSYRRHTPQYSNMFDDPDIFVPSFESQYTSIEQADNAGLSEDDSSKKIITSFADRTLLQSSLPVIPDDLQSMLTAPLKLRVGISSNGNVRYAFSEYDAPSILAAIAANEVMKWRFSSTAEFEDSESAEEIEWGWVIVPFSKAKSSGMIYESDMPENKGALGK